jgi:hypothetical protein
MASPADIGGRTYRIDFTSAWYDFTSACKSMSTRHWISAGIESLPVQ